MGFSISDLLELYPDGKKVTDQGFKRLQVALPDCSIGYAW